MIADRCSIRPERLTFRLAAKRDGVIGPWTTDLGKADPDGQRPIREHFSFSCHSCTSAKSR